MEYATLKPEAEKTIKALADKVRTAEKQLATIRSRARDEAETVDRVSAALDAFKKEAGEHLAGSKSKYLEAKSRIARLTGELGAAREALDMLDTQIRPATEDELSAARQALHRELVALAETARRDCEKVMVEHIAAALAEREAFLDAFKMIFSRFGCDWTGETFDHARIHPDPQHFRPTRDPAFAALTVLTEHNVDFRSTPLAAPARPPVAAEPAKPPENAPATADGHKEPASRYVLTGEPAPLDGNTPAAEAPPAPSPVLDQSAEPGAAAPETLSACPVADALDAGIAPAGNLPDSRTDSATDTPAVDA